MRYSEWLTLGFFSWLVAATGLRPFPRERRLQVAIGGSLIAVAVVAVARLGPASMRDWMPALYILLGYFLSGRLFFSPSLGFEAWLADWDRRTLGDPTTRFASWPPAVLVYLDIVYVGCPLLVPGGFAYLAWTGHAALADRYWTMVAAADFGAFAPLALAQTRPPWALERAAAFRGRAVHRFASGFVRHATIGANTFPSGHVAVSLAVSLAVMAAEPAAGVVLLILTASIAVACVVGRYHYVVDVVTGAALALLMWGAVAALGI